MTTTALPLAEVLADHLAQTASIVLTSEGYTERGSLTIGTYDEFAATFRALGGTGCTVAASWQHPAAGGPVMTVTGSPTAIAYVESLLIP